MEPPTHRMQRFTLLPDPLPPSPSLDDGISAGQEQRVYRQVVEAIYEACSVAERRETAATAVILFLRYFSLRSLASSTDIIIAAGCLSIAAKAHEPRALAFAPVLPQRLLECWYGLPPLEGPGWEEEGGELLRRFHAALCDAEYAVLCALGFDLDVETPHGALQALLRDPALARLRSNLLFQAVALKLCTAILCRDGALALQYSGRELALAVCQAVFERGLAGSQPPEAGLGVEPWFVSRGLAGRRHAAISRRLNANVLDRPAAGAHSPAASSRRRRRSASPGPSLVASPRPVAASPSTSPRLGSETTALGAGAGCPWAQAGWLLHSPPSTAGSSGGATSKLLACGSAPLPSQDWGLPGDTQWAAVPSAGQGPAAYGPPDGGWLLGGGAAGSMGAAEEGWYVTQQAQQEQQQEGQPMEVDDGENGELEPLCVMWQAHTRDF